ncbi:MAG: FAD-dependent oxidoreductase [Acaryochloridaceae cyanobacterium CSU_5_19]|nr:FAD-dependent oxidoreductase [Acaryochloridaceae cyanobacterium CSU_5_19]
MARDYDLVVIGNNRAAPWAAIAAARQSARVVLVATEPESIPISLLLKTWAEQPCFSVLDGQVPSSPIPLSHWATAFAENWAALRSATQLASLGIEQLDGLPQFKADLQSVQVGDRNLRTRRYLLALDAARPTPPLPGMLTPPQLLEQLGQSEVALLNPVVILGEGPTALSLSHCLAGLHHQVTLISSHAHLLPKEDAEAALWVQAHLEAKGVTLSTNTAIQAIHPLPSQGQELITSKGKIKAKTLVWAAEPSLTSYSWLPAQLRYTSQKLWVNAQLQTSQACIYACGSVLGGYTLPDLAEHEAKIAP